MGRILTPFACSLPFLVALEIYSAGLDMAAEVQAYGSVYYHSLLRLRLLREILHD